MATLRDYLEEETIYLPTSDFPESWLDANDFSLTTGTFVFNTERDETEQRFQLLDITLGDGTHFLAVSHNHEEWVACYEIEEYITENLDGVDFFDVEFD